MRFILIEHLQYLHHMLTIGQIPKRALKQIVHWSRHIFCELKILNVWLHVLLAVVGLYGGVWARVDKSTSSL